MIVIIEEVAEVSSELCEAMAKLIPQLSPSASVPTKEELAAIVSSPSTLLFLARDGSGAIVGSLTLALVRIPTGLRAWVEDVVVDSPSRKHGVGKKLCEIALERAKDRGARTVDLTSDPSKKDANRLYPNLGFRKRKTNVYRYKL